MHMLGHGLESTAENFLKRRFSNSAEQANEIFVTTNPWTPSVDHPCSAWFQMLAVRATTTWLNCRRFSGVKTFAFPVRDLKHHSCELRFHLKGAV
jgi:hypothetical protein